MWRLDALEIAHLRAMARKGTLDSEDRSLLLEICARGEDRGETKRWSALGCMAHELRTPLHGVMGLLKLALNKGLDGCDRRLVEMARDAAERAVAVGDNVLELAMLEAGKLTLNMAPLDLHALLRSVIHATWACAHEKGIQLRVDVQPSVPPLVVADDVRLGQVLLNLVSNAVKFTDQGGVVLRVQRLWRGKGWLRFSVEDTGVGVEAAERQAIFEPFAQAESTTRWRLGGAGLGLSISNALVKKMGGTLALDSDRNVGSTFRFDLPLRLGLSSEPEPI